MMVRRSLPDQVKYVRSAHNAVQVNFFFHFITKALDLKISLTLLMAILSHKLMHDLAG